MNFLFGTIKYKQLETMIKTIAIIGFYICVFLLVISGFVYIWYDGPVPYLGKIVITLLYLIVICVVVVIPKKYE